MKINKIYISAFGKFKNYTLNFTEGLNVIHGENENGKSTVMAFIKMMFYGSGRSSSQLSKSPRLKYAPWSGERMAGKIYFEHGGTNYCLEREFMKGDSTDKVHLTNTDLGTTNAVSSSVGYDFFSISASAFERTVFIGNIGGFSNDDEANGEINAKLSNIALTGDEDISYQTVISRIADAKQRLMSKRGKTGKYDKGLLEMDELNRQLYEARETDNRKFQLNKRLDEIKTESEQLSKQYTEVKKIVDSENDIKNQQKLSDYLNLKSELDEINSKIKLNDGKLCDETFVKGVEFCLSKRDSTLQKITETEEEITKNLESIALAENSDGDELERKQKEIEDTLTDDKQALKELSLKVQQLSETIQKENDQLFNISNKKKPFSPVLLSTGIVAAVLALVLLIVNLIPTIICSGLAIILLVLAFIIKPLNKSAIRNAENAIKIKETDLLKLKTRESELTRKIYENTESLNRILTIIGDSTAVIEHKKLALQELKLKLADHQNKYALDTEELLNIFARYRDVKSAEEVTELLPTLRSLADSQKQIKLKLKYISDDLGGISYETAAEKLKNISDDNNNLPTDFDEKKAQLDTLNEKISALKSEFSAITAELKTAFKKSEDSSELELKIKNLSETLENQKYFCEISDIAADVLEKSFAEVRRSYGSVLEKKALSIFSLLTDGAYNQLNVSKSLDITVEKTDDFGTKALDYLSNGTIDQAYLSLRLALCELITDNEKLPLLLDDILCQYDDKRAETALSFLKEYSSDSQAILFTCHNSISVLANKIGLAVKEL